MNIYEKLSAITADLEKVKKNLTVGEGKNQYKAVSEGDILNAVKPLEAKHKVYSYPVEREIVWSDMVDFTSYDKVRTNLCMRVKVTYRFLNLEKPDEFVDMISYGDGVDPQDKACGKAMTYADKYALMKAYKIETGDDPDAKASEEPVGKKQGNQSAAGGISPEEELKLAMAYTFKTGKNAGKKMGELDEGTLKYFMSIDNRTIAKYAKLVWEHLFKDVFKPDAQAVIDAPSWTPVPNEDLPF